MNEFTKDQMRQRLGNISQLQELLFGEQIDKYNQKLEEYNQRLDRIETNTAEFRSTITERIEQLENKLFERIDSVANSSETKIKYVNLKTQEEQRKIQQQLNSVSQHSYKNIDFLQDSLNNNVNNLRSEIVQSKSALDRDLQQLKEQIAEKLEHNLAKLSNNKVSREDLSEVLFELCLKLKRSDIDLELPSEVSGDRVKGDLMLPETKEN